ncbi:hypothetical protein IW261DRAFT_1505466 [Armillaria novae-zelandiae]|uniref:Uncharacterized protein n=1 Tax=Armillaria novae-zelandiae TaxID=153914 RepID=A0AA39NX49_9AGAR|nr:hypothetical protein IW261DRAFT_1505466 [Armillaria novae-zelandiae]
MEEPTNTASRIFTECNRRSSVLRNDSIAGTTALKDLVSEQFLWILENAHSKSRIATATRMEVVILAVHHRARTVGSEAKVPYISPLYTSPISECSDPEHDTESEHSHPASEVYTQHSHSAGNQVFTSNHRTQREAYPRRNIPWSLSSGHYMQNSFHAYLVSGQTFMTTHLILHLVAKLARPLLVRRMGNLQIVSISRIVHRTHGRPLVFSKDSTAALRDLIAEYRGYLLPNLEM